jgi:hypothetical protein
MQIPDSRNSLAFKNAQRISDHIWINANTELCFSRITSQLESPAEWDPLILHVWPVSIKRKREGATSRILLNIAGQIIHTGAMIYHHKPNNHFSWFLTNQPCIWVSWRLTPDNLGSAVGITVAREQTQFLMGKLWWKLKYQRRLERDLDKMLKQLKNTIEKDHTSSQEMMMTKKNKNEYHRTSRRWKMPNNYTQQILRSRLICHRCAYIISPVELLEYGRYRLCQDCAKKYEELKNNHRIGTIEEFVIPE